MHIHVDLKLCEYAGYTRYKEEMKTKKKNTNNTSSSMDGLALALYFDDDMCVCLSYYDTHIQNISMEKKFWCKLNIFVMWYVPDPEQEHFIHTNKSI